MYKILDDITYLGNRFKPGDTCDFRELRDIQIKSLIDRKLIEPIKIAKAPAKPEMLKTKTETRFAAKDKK